MQNKMVSIKKSQSWTQNCFRYKFPKETIMFNEYILFNLVSKYIQD